MKLNWHFPEFVRTWENDVITKCLQDKIYLMSSNLEKKHLIDFRFVVFCYTLINIFGQFSTKYFFVI